MFLFEEEMYVDVVTMAFESKDIVTAGRVHQRDEGNGEDDFIEPSTDLASNSQGCCIS